jgi:AcrR family transcriptional regulator
MYKDDPRVKKTLSLIDQALLENLAQFPLHKITVDKICRSAMINRTTFYKYYTDKFDLLDNYLGRVLDEFKDHMVTTFILATPKTIGDQEYLDNFYQYTQYVDANKKIFEILWKAQFERHIFDEMTKIVHDSIIETLLSNTEIPAENYKFADLYAVFFSSNLMSLIHWWISNQETVSLELVNQIMVQNINDGMFKTFREYIP